MMPTFPPLPPKIPYGGFSPVRFQGRYIRRCLPVDYEFVASHGLPPSFVHLATCNAASSLGVEDVTSSPTQPTCFRCPKFHSHAYRRRILCHSCLATLDQERAP